MPNVKRLYLKLLLQERKMALLGIILAVLTMKPLFVSSLICGLTSFV